MALVEEIFAVKIFRNGLGQRNDDFFAVEIFRKGIGQRNGDFSNRARTGNWRWWEAHLEIS